MRCQKSSQLLKTGMRAFSKPQPIVVRKYGTVQNVSPPLTTPQSSVFENAIAADTPRNTWTKEEIKEIYDTPLMKLAFAAVSQLSPIRIVGLVCLESDLGARELSTGNSTTPPQSKCAPS